MLHRFYLGATQVIAGERVENPRGRIVDAEVMVADVAEPIVDGDPQAHAVLPHERFARLPFGRVRRRVTRRLADERVGVRLRAARGMDLARKRSPVCDHRVDRQVRPQP
ncbi:MAG TPA: hypothetical protein VFA27_02625 [Vicinamibacterales bacterium]|nr:hypothetical protein [Vicinamibacterales bacterium]